MSNTYIIVGAGIAGIAAAEAIRKIDSQGPVIMFTAEHNLPYSRPMLTKTPFYSFDPDKWTIHSLEWFDANRIDLHMDEPVSAVDPSSKTVTSSRGVYHYDKLILATGAENFLPPITGIDSDMVFTIRRAEDIFDLKKVCRASAKAVVIGGGVIGLETAVELWRYGAGVTVLEAAPYLMTRQIDEEISGLIQKKLQGQIDVYTGVSIKAIEAPSAADNACVVLSDGRSFPCDLVIVACGVRACTSIVPDTVNVPRAIDIDDHCRTSDPYIYAAGDCSQHNGINYALWSQSMAQGRTAGLNAAGAVSLLGKFDTSLVINSPLLSLFALGDLGKDPDKKYEIKYISSKDDMDTFFVNPSHGERFEKLFYCGGHLVGAAIIGNLSHMESLKKEILGKETAR